MPSAAAHPDVDDALAKLEASLLDAAGGDEEAEDEIEIEEEEEVEAENDNEFAAEEPAKGAGKKAKGATKAAALKEAAVDEEWNDLPAAPERRPAGKAGKASGNGTSKGKKGTAAPSTPPGAEGEEDDDDEFEDVLVDVADDDDLDMTGGEVDVKPAPAEKPAAKGKGKDKGKTKAKTKKAEAVGADPAEDEESEDFDDIVEETAKGKGKKGKGKGGKARLVAEVDESDTDSEQFDEPIRGPTGKGGKKGKDGKKGGPTGKILKGWVKKFMEERGFGFLVPEDGSEELFFHCMCLDNLPEGQGIDPGHYIHFTKIAQEDGRFKATWVKLVKGGPPMPAKYGGGAGKGKKGKGDGKDKDKDKGKGKDNKGGGKGWWDEWDWWGKGKKGWSKGWDEPAEERPAKVARTSSSGEPTTPAEWQTAQDRLFGHMKPVPAPWIRIRSKSSGSIYLYNSKTGESKATDGEDLSAPLPDNWTTKTSSSGKTYYYNSKTGDSTFERPS